MALFGKKRTYEKQNNYFFERFFSWTLVLGEIYSLF